MLTSFKEATHVDATSATTYTARFSPDWCVGTGELSILFTCRRASPLIDRLTVPHGGYVTSIFLSVAKRHFDTVRADYQQPHTIAVQLNFLRRTSLGLATFTVSESKLGQRTSTIHIALNQGGEPIPLVVGYFTQSNINTETGMSVTLPHTLHPAPPILTSVNALREGTEPQWKLHKNQFSKFRKAGQHLLTYLPRIGQAGVIDQWLTLANGDKFTQESLGFVVDSFPSMLETAHTSGEFSNELQRLAKGAPQVTKPEGSRNHGYVGERSQWARFWYPTVLLNMEIKKALSQEGSEWLLSRVKAKQIHNGRMDIEIIIFDQAREIVALSNHVALIVPAERNVLRSEKGSVESESKL